MVFGFHDGIDQAIALAAQPVRGAAGDYDGLLDLIGDARFVLLGEASHGTHQFYAARARITQRLIAEHGFRALAVEADWPDAWRVNRFVRGDTGEGCDHTAAQALEGFQRFPAWMWRNADVVQLVDWLHGHNAALPEAQRVGFYGLDLYSLFRSIDEVLHYLDQVDPAAAREARTRYACFDHYDEDTQAYGYAANLGLSDSCRNGVVAQLQQMQQRARQYLKADGPSASDAYFHAQQNARLVMNAEAYYRTMFQGRVASWNLRDRHMADTLAAVATHLATESTTPAGAGPRIVVWAHNSHLGDACATEAQRLGEINVGQLARERYGAQARLIGFSTYEGWVTAASRWDGPAERKRVLPALHGSYEAMLHNALPGDYMLPLTPGSAQVRALEPRRLERAIGVLYLPATERQSHYFFASLPRQFDAIVHFDNTDALEPLEVLGRPGDEVPETYPEGI